MELNNNIEKFIQFDNYTFRYNSRKGNYHLYICTTSHKCRSTLKIYPEDGKRVYISHSQYCKNLHNKLKKQKVESSFNNNTVQDNQIIEDNIHESNNVSDIFDNDKNNTDNNDIDEVLVYKTDNEDENKPKLDLIEYYQSCLIKDLASQPMVNRKITSMIRSDNDYITFGQNKVKIMNVIYDESNEHKFINKRNNISLDDISSVQDQTIVNRNQSIDFNNLAYKFKPTTLSNNTAFKVINDNNNELNNKHINKVREDKLKPISLNKDFKQAYYQRKGTEINKKITKAIKDKTIEDSAIQSSKVINLKRNNELVRISPKTHFKQLTLTEQYDMIDKGFRSFEDYGHLLNLPEVNNREDEDSDDRINPKKSNLKMKLIKSTKTFDINNNEEIEDLTIERKIELPPELKKFFENKY
jgi:hypothetical protein